MAIGRILRHLFYPPWMGRRIFTDDSMRRIEEAIMSSESRHAGEIRFAVESTLDFFPLVRGESARDRAVDLFSRLRIWDTEENNGVLIYLLLADHDVEIVADRGIHRMVGEDGWEAICRVMEERFRLGDFAGGVIHGIGEVGALLERYFPLRIENTDELPNTPLRLDA